MNKKQIYRIQFELAIEFHPRKVVFFFSWNLKNPVRPFFNESLEPVEIQILLRSHFFGLSLSLSL
jgi:hypothetical protein